MKKILSIIIFLVLILMISATSINAFSIGENDLSLENNEIKSIPFANVYVDDDNVQGPWDGSFTHPYRNIQDAIDNAYERDLIFVYNGTYYENLIINKSIKLKGEDKEITIIDANFADNPMWIKKSNVSIREFKIINSNLDLFSSGIKVTSKIWIPPGEQKTIISDISISNCILENNDAGIRLDNVNVARISNCIFKNNFARSIYILNADNLTITNCEIHDNGAIVQDGQYPGGIGVSDNPLFGDESNFVEISYCNVTNNIGHGIGIFSNSSNIEIHHNTISKNTYNGIFVSRIVNRNIIINNNVVSKNGNFYFFRGGIVLQDCHNCVTIKNNIISSNDIYGVYLLRSSGNVILENNFINNNISASFKYKSSNFCNIWNKNYWDRPRLLPKAIFGFLFEENSIPWVEFDWHPAKNPYAI